MPASGQRLTLEQHRALAEALEWMQDYLLDEAIRLVDTYGASAAPGQLADQAWLALDALRLEMEDRRSRDTRRWPEAGHSTIQGPVVAEGSGLSNQTHAT